MNAPTEALRIWVKNMAESKKSEIRSHVLALRKELDEQIRKRAAILLTERILGHQWYYRSDILLGFASYGTEIDTAEILTDALRRGKQVYLPKVEGTDMIFYRMTDTGDLQKGYRGILEPKGDTEVFDYAAYIEHAETAEKILMLMPGVAFDKERHRIGYGKGFYDRYLAGKEALQLRTIAVGFKCQMVEEISAEELDIKPYQVICV